MIKLKANMRGERIRKRVQMIRQRDRMGIWRVKKEMDRKNQVQKQIANNEGKLLMDADDILQEYKQYYEELLTPKKANTEEEK